MIVYKGLFKKIDELVLLLISRGNPSSEFFVNAKKNLQADNRNIDELNSLIKCYAITQYANFSKKEEDILNQIIDFAREIKKQITGTSYS